VQGLVGRMQCWLGVHHSGLQLFVRLVAEGFWPAVDTHLGKGGSSGARAT
jgi:hypothetical protein